MIFALFSDYSELTYKEKRKLMEKVKNYKVKNWLLRSSYDADIHNVKPPAPLVDAKKVLFPPLYINLGLIKQFVKKMNPEGEAFKRI